MKRVILISLLLLLFVGAVSAQGIMGIGPEIGLNFANVGGGR